MFLKIDTQGFEKPVLEGARAILDRVPLVQLECSLVPLYQGAEPIEDMIGMMRSLGYDPVDLQPTFHHRDSGHLMQADVLFVRLQRATDLARDNRSISGGQALADPYPRAFRLHNRIWQRPESQSPKTSPCAWKLGYDERANRSDRRSGSGQNETAG